MFLYLISVLDLKENRVFSFSFHRGPKFIGTVLTVRSTAPQIALLGGPWDGDSNPGQVRIYVQEPLVIWIRQKFT